MGNLSQINIALRLREVLFHHDVPQLFSALDNVDTTYLCLLVSDTEDELEYIGKPVSKSRLESLRSGKNDLRTVVQNPELGFWYLITRFFDETAYAAKIELENLPDEWLPGAGFYIPQAQSTGG